MKKAIHSNNIGSIYPIIIIFLVAAITLSGFVFSSRQYDQIGFPLDDAWIHQTFARNLAINGEWAFVLGQPTSGSTSPIWTLILGLGYLLNIPPLYWAFFTGWLTLAGQAYFGEKLFRSMSPGWNNSFPWIALFLVGEWHLVWAAASGMETLLLGLFIGIVFYLLSKPEPSFFLIGLLSGFSVWIRPDGVTLLGPGLLLILLNVRSLEKKFYKLAKLIAGFLICFIPYLAFNYFLSGSPWPNTFYAKQAEYFTSLQQPFFIRFYSLLKLPAVGAGSLLIPATLYLYKLRKHNIFYLCLAALIWWLGYTLLYTFRLPLPYQHGRYLMPAMPILFILSGSGFAYYVSDPGRSNRIHWFLKRVWLISVILVWAAFYGLGAKSYSQDVAIIESEMVAAAKWVSINTDQNAIIAAHDIGALGYFGNRAIIDMAGLVSPEVIPFIRDEMGLANHLDNKNADFLVSFPSWYPNLTGRAQLIYSTNGETSPKLGGENMHIYRWKKH